MSEKKIKWGKEIVQTGSDIAELAKDVGIPGIGLVARFAQHFYDKHLQNRFEKFLSEASVNEDLIDKILSDEDHSNCFYAALETVRQTHSKIGIIALALIYRDHWNNESYLVGAMQSFAQISDKTIDAFLVLFEGIPAETDYLYLGIQRNGEDCFHELYNEAVELIRRNFFVMSTGTSMHNNGPVQGMKWNHSDSYYAYCKAAKARI